MAKKAIEDRESWTSEFEAVDFGDRRLKNRLMRVADELSSQPLDPINKACSGWADTKATYRLFANDKVVASEILDAHRSRTWERAKDHPFILAIQDTTYLNYTNHIATEGLGHIGTAHNSHTQGLIQHTTLALSPEGLPLGILDQYIWARDKLPMSERSKNIKALPLEEKESVRWLRSLELVNNTAPPGVEVITIGDRECDIYEFVASAENDNSSFVVRASVDRAIYTAESEDEVSYLWEYLEAQPEAGTVKIAVPARGAKEPARLAHVEVRFTLVEIRRPKKARFFNNSEIQKSVFVHAILLQEPNPPKDVTQLEWMLLTNTAVVTLEDAIEKMNWYRHRWSIEVFHKILKSGCRVEDCRLGTADRLKKYLTLFSIIAWRLHWMTYINRNSPDACCDSMLAEHEWKALFCKIHKTQELPKTPPTMRQAVRWIAQLGGFLARKGDGEPGIVTIWRGWQRLTDIADDWLLFKGD